jgi:hypothetical protein
MMSTATEFGVLYPLKLSEVAADGHWVSAIRPNFQGSPFTSCARTIVVKQHRAITFNTFFIANSFVKCKSELTFFDSRPVFLSPEYLKPPPFLLVDYFLWTGATRNDSSPA